MSYRVLCIDYRVKKIRIQKTNQEINCT